ncbi:MAG: glycosyltransferase family 39 protein [Candidatus Omnitrophota bacterium]
MKKILLAAFGLFFFVNTVTLFCGHNWGDDFAQYIHHAINIIEHQPYSSNIVLDLWVIVPPGFPFLLSALIYWFGVNLKVLKFLNVVFWALSALLAYDITLKRLGKFWAGLIAIWFLSAPFFFWYKQNILSDIPFAFFALLSIWSFLRYAQRDRGSPLITIFSMSYAAIIRSAGFGLIIAAVIYLGAVKKNWKRSLGFLLGGIIAWCIQWQYGASFFSHLDSGAYAPRDTGQYLLKMILEFFITVPVIYKYVSPSAFILGPILLLVISAVVFFRIRGKALGFMGCFTSLYLLGVLLWPVQGGSRYILPLIVPLTIYLIELARKKIPDKVLAGIFMLLILQNIFVIGTQWEFNDDGVFQKDSFEMMSWVEKNLKENEHYMFYKPRALSLFTGRIGAPFWVYARDSQEWYRRIKPLNITYLICDKQVDQISQYDILNLVVDDYALCFNTIWENPQYKILHLTQLKDIQELRSGPGR